MAKSSAQILEEFQGKFNLLKSQSLQITTSYRESIDRIKQHLLVSRLRHKPVNLGIIATYPKADEYIEKINKIQNEVIKLRNTYFGMINQI